MDKTARILTVLSVVAALTGVAWYAIAASCTGSLPATNAIKGWEIWADTSKAGKLGEKPSYDAFNGAVDSMKAEGIRYFAEQMYKQTGTKKHLTVDVFQLSSTTRAKALYASKKNGYKTAKPISHYTSIKDQALVGTIKTFTFGCCQRGKYVCLVTMTGASSAQDRATVKTILTYISKKLAPQKPKS